MRFIAFIALLLPGWACHGPKNSTMPTNPLNGTWIPVKQEFAGTPLPSAVFAKQKLIISDSNYTVIAESVDKGITTVIGDRMDIYGKEGVNTGKHFMALHKLENGELTICYNLAGNAYPENFDTRGKPMYFLSVFRKE